jgi:hypothetical protein
MTTQEYQAYEQSLIKRGYKKQTYSYCYEDYSYYKAFREDEEQDRPSYQVIVRVYDMNKYGEDRIDLMFVADVSRHTDESLEFTLNHTSIPIQEFEKKAKAFYEFVKKQFPI